MPLAEAASLVEYAQSASPQAKTKSSKVHSAPSHNLAGPLHMELADPLADRLALAELAEWCQQFSPSVALEEGDEPESLLLDVTGLAKLFGGEGALARRVVRACNRRGLAVRVALADTLGAAWALAHFADLKCRGGAEDAAAILSALRLPLVVPAGESWARLAPLPADALRLPEETCTLLADLGVRRIDQIATLPRSTLLARFGPKVLEQLDRASGAAPEALVARALPAEREFAWPFEHPTARQEMIEFALAELVARACGALARERLGMLRLECRFEYERHAADRFVVGMFRASACPRHVGELVRLKLEQLRFREPVAAIRAAVLAEDRLEFHQQEMFFADSLQERRQQQNRDAPRAISTLVDRLSNRLGARAVVRPWLLASAQPEFACQYLPLASLSARPRRASPRASRDRAAAPSPIEASCGDRPFYLEREPRRLTVLSVAPDGPPARVRLAGRDERIVRCWGPERIETGWWRSRCVRRDYYQVETGGGQRYWLFRELTSGGWFLHGEFA